MRLLVKKLEVADLGQLQSLVVEHLDEIEHGLTVLDSRLLLGHATIDIVALDTEGSLVLTTVGFTADEDMLLKAVEAYSWCLEYPDAIRRLYPSVEISAARPPRLMFVVERLPDAFHRKIKQLGFSEVDCVEFRHLDVSGTPAAYFDTIARLRRGGKIAEPVREPAVRRVPERHAPEPIVAERAVETIVERVAERADKVVPIAAPIAARATSVRLQKMLNTSGHGPSNGSAAPVIEMAPRAAAAAAPRVEMPRAESPAPRVETARVEVAEPRVETPRAEPPAPRLERVEAPRAQAPVAIVVEAPRPAPAPRAEAPTAVIEPTARVTLREAVAAPAPVAVAAVAAPAPARAAQAPEPRVSFAEIAKELLGSPVPPPRLEAPAVIPRPPVEEITRAALEDIAAAAAEGVEEPESAIAVEEAPAELTLDEAVAALIEEPAAEPAVEAIAEPVIEIEPEPEPEPVIAPVLAAPAPVAEAAPVVEPAPVPAPAPVAAAAPVPPPAAPAPALPQEFNGLKFPNDGVLTRQWMEFLNQMAATK